MTSRVSDSREHERGVRQKGRNGGGGRRCDTIRSNEPSSTRRGAQCVERAPFGEGSGGHGRRRSEERLRSPSGRRARRSRSRRRVGGVERRRGVRCAEITCVGGRDEAASTLPSAEECFVVVPAVQSRVLRIALPAGYREEVPSPTSKAASQSTATMPCRRASAPLSARILGALRPLGTGRSSSCTLPAVTSASHDQSRSSLSLSHTLTTVTSASHNQSYNRGQEDHREDSQGQTTSRSLVSSDALPAKSSANQDVTRSRDQDESVDHCQGTGTSRSLTLSYTLPTANSASRTASRDTGCHRGKDDNHDDFQDPTISWPLTNHPDEDGAPAVRLHLSRSPLPNTNDCDAQGRCVHHPRVRLRTKRLLSHGWRVCLSSCPECCAGELRRIDAARQELATSVKKNGASVSRGSRLDDRLAPFANPSVRVGRSRGEQHRKSIPRAEGGTCSDLVNESLWDQGGAAGKSEGKQGRYHRGKSDARGGRGSSRAGPRVERTKGDQPSGNGRHCRS